MEKIDKPWGYELLWAKTDKYVGKLLFIKAGHRLSKQYHEQKEETVFVMKGVLYNYDADDNVTKHYSGDSLHIVPNQVHRFGAADNNVELIEVSTPELDDVVRLADDYSR
jgi:quercetin dioxygenase-like cupin family protein